MTTLNEARQLVYDQFELWWKDGADPLTPFCFDNETLPGPPLVWARCAVRAMPGGQATLGPKGNRKYHRKGMARVQVFTEPGKGTYDADRLCKVAQDMFEGEALAGVKFTDAELIESGLVDEDRWSLSTVQVNFDYEEIK